MVKAMQAGRNLRISKALRGTPVSAEAAPDVRSRRRRLDCRWLKTPSAQYAPRAAV